MTSGFTFGAATTTAAPAFGTGNMGFGTQAAQPAQQFGFGGLSTSTPTLFGTQTAPATSTLGFNKPVSGFGAPAPQATGFGASFGAATSQPSAAFGASTFGAGAPNIQSTGLTFGTPAPASTVSNMSFGAPTGAATGLSFGTPASTGLSFGQPAGAAAPGLSFRTPATAAPAGLSFGAPAPTSTGLSFGAPTAAQTTASPFALATSVPSTGLTSGMSFGATTSAPAGGLNFGATTLAAPSLGQTPSLGLRFGATPITTAPTLNFGGATLPTNTGLNFGTQPNTGLSFGLGGVSSAAPTLGLATATSAPSASLGLGGVVSALSKPGTASAAQKEVPPKEQPLMNEFTQLVEQFKKVVQDEKIRSSEVARSSVKEFHKVENNLDILNNHFNQIENQLQANRSMVEKLKLDTAKGLQNIEIAQRTQETPPGLQYENQAPLKFFVDLVDDFEREMQILKVKIDNTEKFVRKSSEWNVLTSQDLAGGLRQLHEIFVALAGRMQAIHNQVETQKEIFLSIRRQTIKDNVNPFQRSTRNSEALNIIMKNAQKLPPQLASGPTPFNNMALGANLALQAQSTQPSGFGAPTTTTSNMASPFTTSNMFNKPSDFSTQPFQLGTSQGFQLQKPPTGNKRGKQ